MSTAVLEPSERLDSQVMPPFPVLRFTLQQYWDLRETGVLDAASARYELLQGWIVPKVTQLPPHAWTVTQVDEVIRPILSAGWLMRTQCAINTEDSEPEPDHAIVRGPNVNYVSRHPRGNDIGLLIEVADSTLVRDRRKAEIYAADGIDAYWIINLVDRQIEVYTDPDPANRTYRNREVFTPGQSLAIELDGNTIQTIAVDDLLPPAAS